MTQYVKLVGTSHNNDVGTSCNVVIIINVTTHCSANIYKIGVAKVHSLHRPAVECSNRVGTGLCQLVIVGIIDAECGLEPHKKAEKMAAVEH